MPQSQPFARWCESDMSTKARDDDSPDSHTNVLPRDTSVEIIANTMISPTTTTLPSHSHTPTLDGHKYHCCIRYPAVLPDYDDTMADEDLAGVDLKMAPPVQQERPLLEEIWYFTGVDRAVAETLLVGEGDFLVRESLSEMGQYILSILQEG